MTQKKRRRGKASGSVPHFVPQRGTHRGRVGGERQRQVGSLGGTAFRGVAAVCDDGGRLSESRGGRFCALLPEAEGASACVLARATSQREAGGRRRAGTKAPAVPRLSSTVRRFTRKLYTTLPPRIRDVTAASGGEFESAGRSIVLLPAAMFVCTWRFLVTPLVRSWFGAHPHNKQY